MVLNLDVLGKVSVLQVDQENLNLFVEHFAGYGFWGLLAFVFVIFGLKHVAPIITAFGKWHNDRHKANLSHKRSMQKMLNKIDKDKSGKSK